MAVDIQETELDKNIKSDRQLTVEEEFNNIAVDQTFKGFVLPKGRGGGGGRQVW